MILMFSIETVSLPLIQFLLSLSIADESWFHFLEHESMKELRNRASFIHVDIPGQEDGAKDLPAE